MIDILTEVKSFFWVDLVANRHHEILIRDEIVFIRVEIVEHIISLLFC